MSNNHFQRHALASTRRSTLLGHQLALNPSGISQQTSTIFEDSQIRADKPTEAKLADDSLSSANDEGFGSMNQIVCSFCNNPILMNIYHQHINSCPHREASNLRSFPPSINTVLEDTSFERDQELEMVPDENRTQPRSVHRFTARRPGRRLNNLRSLWRNPRNFTNQPADLLRINFPFFTNVLGNIQPPPSLQAQPMPNPVDQDQIPDELTPMNTNSRPNPSLQPNDPIQPSQPTQSIPNPADNIPQGLVIIRSTMQGPDGVNVARVRIIPMSGLAAPTANVNPEEEENGAFGALMRMLAGMQDGRFLNIVSLMDLFDEERGLDEEDLESLPVVIYDKERFKNVEESAKKCPICLDNFEDGNEVRYLWCIHRFHKNCVDQWLDKHTNCPICKKDFSEAKSANYE